MDWYTVLNWLLGTLGALAGSSVLTVIVSKLIDSDTAQNLVSKLMNLGKALGLGLRKTLTSSKIKWATKGVVILIVLSIEFLNRIKEGLLVGAASDTLKIIDALVGVYHRGGNKLAESHYNNKLAKHLETRKQHGKS